ncbi:asparagine synthase-related protein [Butyrivibrio sp. XPD2006]|uniref:asparagine synthase-related protein n=1 Tax=Butyrivibrio sp. XPD2006 TaxID=1280668 RepID=UPI0003B60C22|nr:asparagine synthase-related protein [Butyrivibrio sp. XPD2006]
MSAIYGMVNLDKVSVKKEQLDKMEQEYREFKIDRFSSYIYENAAFGTGLQFITKQSRDEVLPYFDKSNNNLFTADCYLDNRDELITQLAETGLSIGVSVNEGTPDAMLIYLSYLRWGDSFCDHILGVFAIALYNVSKNEFYLYVDHCGDRCVHYYLSGNTIFFSTIIKPIQAATDFTINISEKYITACESNFTPDMVLYPGLTPYDNIYQLLASERLTVKKTDSKASYSISKYWDPVNSISTLKLANDEEYKKLFLETYSKCVTDCLNVDGKIGSFLSSGLDSTSVAALASLFLKEKNEYLHSYTSIPIKGFQNTNGIRLENESEPVQKFCNLFGNIIPTFLSCDGKTALTELERFVDFFNAPIKYSVNAIWMDEVYKKAAEDGCKVLLTGQHGNCTVSYGNLITRMWEEFKHIHFKTMIEQYNAFSSKFHISKKHFIKTLIKEFSSLQRPQINFDTDALSKKELINKYNLIDEYTKKRKRLGGTFIHSEHQRKQAAFNPLSFQQVSFANAHFELKYGIISRDPTRDKRIMELCLSFPFSCFSDGMYERRLITYYMKDILPDFIHMQMYRRGIQGADFMFRIKQTTTNIKEYSDNLSSARLSDYLDKDKIKELTFNTDDNNIMLRSLHALSLFIFLKNQKNCDTK